MKKEMDCIFHNEWDQKDEIIKEAFYEMSGQINASDLLKRQIDRRLQKEEKKEEHSMKHFSIKKVVIGVVAASFLLGTAVLAGSGIKYYVAIGTEFPKYTKFEDIGKAEAEIGYKVDAVESFSNGYKMTGIDIIENSIQNEAGQKEEEQKEIRLSYGKEGDEEIAFYARKLFSGESEETVYGPVVDKTLQCGKTKVIFTQYTYKSVPPEYELTAEDKKNMEDEHFTISYGTSEVKMNQYYSALWVKDGMVYSLGGFNLSMSGDEMLNMAKEIIENGSR